MKPAISFFFLFSILLVFESGRTYCQQVRSSSSNPAPYFSYGKGLGITSPDSLFKLNIRFRIQNRLSITNFDNWEQAMVEARVRRLRLRFDGFIYTPRLTYVLQLGFSKSDMDDGTANGDPQIIRDAMVVYSFNKRFSLGLGQSKLPGNRQRVTSSGDQQFVDRSIVNATFNIDRDFGVQAYYNNYLNNFYYVLRGAVTTGEGRNTSASSSGLAYTGRLEILPFGPFSDGGDYFESDLSREPKPKLSCALTYSKNLNTTRSGGQTGVYLYDTRDILTRMIDLLYKHNGWALSTEFIHRTTNDPLTENEEGSIRYVYKGHGENYQLSYLWKKNYEVALRYTHLMPQDQIYELAPKRREYTAGASKYIKGHRLKLQTDVSYLQSDWITDANPDTNAWQWRFQIEAGI